VSAGTVKKSIAATASRWFPRNVSHRFTRCRSRGACRIHRETLLSERSETQLQQFAVNARRTRGRILSNHAQDQGANLFADPLPSSYLSYSGDPCPIQTKSRAMPVHDGSRRDQDESLCPTGPERSQGSPEQLVQGSQSTARS
jgi:hypothetical protein